MAEVKEDTAVVCRRLRRSVISGSHCQLSCKSHKLGLGYSSWLFRLGHGLEVTSCQHKGRNVTYCISNTRGGERFVGWYVTFTAGPCRCHSQALPIQPLILILDYKERMKKVIVKKLPLCFFPLSPWTICLFICLGLWVVRLFSFQGLTLALYFFFPFTKLAFNSVKEELSSSYSGDVFLFVCERTVLSPCKIVAVLFILCLQCVRCANQIKEQRGTQTQTALMTSVDCIS